jgi:PAS domain S-box-containing protein
MIRLPLLLLVLLITINISLQATPDNYGDSLKLRLQEHKELDTARVELLYRLANHLLQTNKENAYHLSEEAFQLSDKLDYDQGRAQSLWIKGEYYSYKEEYEKAIQSYENAIVLFKKTDDKYGLAASYNNLGAIFHQIGSYLKTLENNFKTLRIYEELGEEMGMAEAINNIGVIYHELGDLPRAISYYQKSLEFGDQNNKSLLALNHNNLGTVYQENKDYIGAREQYMRSLVMYREINDSIGILLGYLNLGSVYTEMEEFSTGSKLLYEGLEMSISLGSRSFMGWYYFYLAELYEKMEHPDRVLKYSQQAFDLGKELSETELIAKSSFLLSERFAEKNDFKRAYEFYVLYKSLSDSLIDINKIRIGIGQEYEYRHEKEVELTIMEQQLRDTLLKAEINRQRAIRNILLVAFLVMVFFLIIIYRSLRKNRETNKVLRHQKGEIEEKKAILEQQNKEIIDTNEELQSLKQNLVKQNRVVQESKDKFNAILTAIPDMMFVLNKKGVYLDYFANKKDLLVVSPCEIIGHSMHDTFSLDVVEKFDQAFERCQENRTVETVEYSIDVSEEERYYEARIVYFESDKYLCIVRDISERKVAEREQEIKEELQKKIALAEDSLRFKQNFLANMSHEIRTPLSGILGMAEILTDTPLDEKQADYLSTIVQSGENLMQIINMVLDYSKIEAGKINLRKRIFRFKNIADNAEKLFHSICKKPIEFNEAIDPELPGFIEGDELRILQVVNNLISNAVKFTEKGRITFKAEQISRCLTSGQIKIKITITDTGKGIAEQTIHKLFQPFSQIEDIDTRDFEGTGLGLAICREIVQMHGGEIGVDTQVHKGSSFWFTFLAQVSDDFEKAEETKVILSHYSKKLRILLVEDKKVNQKVITLVLNTMGHEITIAGHGGIALEVFQPGRFDLILMDIQMPVMDGITTTQKLREKYTNLPPIVGLSANAFEGDREKYMEKGLDEYLTKPINKSEFKAVVDKFSLHFKNPL